MTERETPSEGAFDVRIAWRRDDAGIEADAIAMWERSGMLPGDVTPERRAKELVAAAYNDGKLAAVATAIIEHIEFLRARFAVLRGTTDPQFRRSHAQTASLCRAEREALEAWALAHPEEKIAGGIGFVDPGAWGDLHQAAGLRRLWPLTVVAYTHDGKQVRAAWFDHFRLD